MPVITVSDGTNLQIGPYGQIGTGQLLSVWCATARDTGGNANLMSERHNKTVFMRGLKENITFSTNSARSWRWRRICFTTKGLYQSHDNTVDSVEASPIGWARLIANHNTSALGSIIRMILFKGTQDRDWQSIFDAKVDTTRVTLKYDRTTILNSGNDVGRYFTRKLWHPMNKNLTYDSDENGEEITPSRYSVQSKEGMGDYYVVDIIQAGSGATASDQIVFNPQATLYWHEK